MVIDSRFSETTRKRGELADFGVLPFYTMIHLPHVPCTSTRHYCRRAAKASQIKATPVRNPSSETMNTHQSVTLCSSLPVFRRQRKWILRIRKAVALIALLRAVQFASATSYTWNVTSGNWSISTNWNPNAPAGGPLSTDTAIFGIAGAASSPSVVNNTVDFSFAGTVAGLTYNDNEPGIATYVYPVTQIPANQTLTVTNSLLVGGNNDGGGTGGVNNTNAFATFGYVVGGGTLKVTAPTLFVGNGGSASGANACAFFNLSGLTNFVFSNTNGTIGVATNGGALSSFTRLGGTMFLASGSNNITAAAVNLGTSTSAQAGPSMFPGSSGLLAGGPPAVLALGPGTNMINANAINVANQKCSFVVSNSGGGLRIRGATGADADANVNITLGNRNVGGGTGQTTGQMMLNGCAVDIKAGTLIVGENIGGAPSTAADGGNGTLQFDTGMVSANSLLMAFNTSANNGANQAQCTGTIQVGAQGTLFIGAGQLFALATATASGPSTGTLIISNGLVNCQGPITMGAHVGTTTGTIQLVGSGTLNMGPGSYVGVLSNAVTSLILDTNSTLSLSIPSVSYTNICVQNLTWPTPDTGLTISVAAVPAGINPGAVFAFLNYSGTLNGAFNNPNLVLPPGVQGNLSLVGNTIYLTITAGVGPGTGGVNQLLNNGFALTPPGTNWTSTGGASVVSTNSTYPNTGSCTSDTRNIQGFIGPNVAKLTGSFVPGGSTNSWSQSAPVAAGSTITAGAFTYVAHEDIMSGNDGFYYEVDFLDGSGALIAAYESSAVTNLSCGESTPFALDTWNLLAVTNQMQVTGGVNTGVIIGNVASIITVPPQTVTAKFKAILIQPNATNTGSVYFSGANLGVLSNPVAPTLSSVSPNLTTLCTNTELTCTASSTETTISSVQIIVTSTTLGGNTTNTTTYTIGSPSLTVTGVGTSSANINLTLAANTIYQSVVVKATDADGVTVTSPAVNFDTLTPALVIEAADFNFSSGQFFDTPPNGGFALYTNQVGTQGIDENKITRTNTQSYYRTNDATIIQAAGPIAPSGLEQKFVTAAADGDTNDIEVAIAYDTPGDWLNYSRTFGTNGTYSAAPGTYNVWCYLATSGSGAQAAFYEVTNDPTTTGQLTNFLGNFGGSTFSDNNYFKYEYAPLVDQFGNAAALTVSNGVHTFRAQITSSDTPNMGFYMFVPVAPIFTPVFLHVYPTAPFEPTNEFTFTVGPAQGASISTNGIGLTVNGVPITSGLTFIPIAGGGWTVNYAIQSNAMYNVAINVTNTSGLTANFSTSFDTFNIINYHWMAVDYDFSTNNGTGSGGSVGNGWTGGLFIDNPVPTGDTNAPTDQSWQFASNSYFAYPTGFYPASDSLAGTGAVAQQGVDINWPANTNQDPGLVISNSIYRGASVIPSNPLNGGDGVGTQVATDSFLLPEFGFAKTNNASGGPDPNICEFNVGYFYAGNWLNYTHTYPAGSFNVWARMAAGAGAFSGCSLSLVTSGVGTLNQTTQVLGTFSDATPAGWQTYHWIQMLDTNGNPAFVQLSGKATLRLTAPPNAGPGSGALNPLYFMLTPAVAPVTPFDITAVINGANIQISIPTQGGHTYTLWHSTNLSPGSWSQVGGSITGDGTVHVVSQSAAGQSGFYRVIAQ